MLEDLKNRLQSVSLEKAAVYTKAISLSAFIHQRLKRRCWQHDVKTDLPIESQYIEDEDDDEDVLNERHGIEDLVQELIEDIVEAVKEGCLESIRSVLGNL